MGPKSGKTQAEHPRREESKPDRAQPWLNTKPRANGQMDVRDLNRGIDRLEMLLGR